MFNIEDYEKYQQNMEKIANGEEVICDSCKKGTLIKVSDYLIKCSKCGKEIIIN